MDRADEGVFVSVLELKPRVMLVSFSPGVRWESFLVSNVVVSKEEGFDVERVVPSMEEVGYVILEDSEKIEPEELNAWPGLLELSVVIVVCMEGRIFTVSMENSEVESVSMVGLLKGGGKVVTGSNMVPNFSVVFMRLLLRSEVAEVGVEGLFPGTMGS